MNNNSIDLLKKLEAYANIDPPGICWLWPDDTGESYCRECAEEQINYFGNGTNVDGGWGGQETECCVHCATCGRVLDYWLLEEGVAYELDHFRTIRFHKPLLQIDAFHVARMLASTPDDREVVAVARQAVRAINKHNRTQIRRPGHAAQQARKYAVIVDGYGEAHYTAPSAAKARAQAYRDFCDAIAGKTFHEFLVMSRVRLVERLKGKSPVQHANSGRAAS